MSESYLKGFRARAVEDVQTLLDAAELDLAVQAYQSGRTRLQHIRSIFVAAEASELADIAHSLASATDYILARDFPEVSRRISREMELLLYL